MVLPLIAAGLRIAAPFVAKKILVPVLKKSISFVAGTPTRAAVSTVAAGALVSSPTLRTAAKETPKTLYTTGKEIGKSVEGLSEDKKQSSKKFGTAGLVAAGIVGVVAGVKGSDLLDREPKANANALLPSPSNPLQEMPKVKDNSGLVSETGEPVPVTDLDKPRRKRRKTASQMPFKQTIRQSVNVIVTQKNSSKKYIKMGVLN